jgi:hypothetical protein
MTGYVVVLLSGSACEEYPQARCVTSVLGPYPREGALAVAARQPSWTCPHVMMLTKEEEVP